ncbi:M23 family metallopeptidase [Novosphingobium sp. 9]|uniref:M23 family metallopeptidase n=1 Tax=Novosphingobium sp. 9 TaxID=2025349 RepID=UPI0021B5D312|nr:peptidoglycan DD-metalloendopeptidase family protein [Novosphingobium sp. 9]
MNLPNVAVLKQRLRNAFADREFIVRSQGQIRFVKLSSRTQIAAAAVAFALVGGSAASLGALALGHAAAGDRQTALAGREAQVAQEQARLARYREGVEARTEDLARRQQVLEQLMDAHLGSDGATDAALETSPAASASTATDPNKISAAVLSLRGLPTSAQLDRIEAQQFAMVDRLTRYADARSESAVAQIRGLGLNPNAMMVRARAAEGGPLQLLSTGTHGTIDPRFRALGKSLARMDSLENGLASIPQVSPAHVAYVSSSYGYRSDPFTGASAFHAGLDFPGPMGSPIYAAAKGTVTFVGQRSGYGNCVEVSHGNGLMTRYGHLSGFDAHVGEKVDAGTQIARMGSTGRSTGSHLHFEVRVNGNPVNPRPFLEAARNVQQQETR